MPTPTAPLERRLTLAQAQDLLSTVLPLNSDGTPHRPSVRLLYQWMERTKDPMPWIAKPGTGKGTGRRTGRWFLASQLMAWLDDPAGYWTARRKAS